MDTWTYGHGEHYKSSLITFGLTIQAILNNPNITIGFFSEKFAIASSFLCQIKREFEENKTLKKAFPDIFYKDPANEVKTNRRNKWNEHEFIVKRNRNPKESTITAQGLDSLRVGAHYDLMVYDDVITEKSVATPEIVEKITQNFELSLSMSKQGGVKRNHWN